MIPEKFPVIAVIVVTSSLNNAMNIINFEFKLAVVSTSADQDLDAGLGMPLVACSAGDRSSPLTLLLGRIDLPAGG